VDLPAPGSLKNNIPPKKTNTNHKKWGEKNGKKKIAKTKNTLRVILKPPCDRVFVFLWQPRGHQRVVTWGFWFGGVSKTSKSGVECPPGQPLVKKTKIQKNKNGFESNTQNHPNTTKNIKKHKHQNLFKQVAPVTAERPTKIVTL